MLGFNPRLIAWVQVANFYLGHVPSTDEIKVINEQKLIPNFPSLRCFYRNIGSWLNVLEEAGLLENYDQPRRNPYTRSELLEFIFKFEKEFGHFSFGSEIERTKGYPSRTPYIKEFGSFEIALEVAKFIWGQRLNAA